MKTVLTIIAAVALFVTPVKAQPTGITFDEATNILGQVTEFLKTTEHVTEWTYVPYLSFADGMVDKKGKEAEVGGGIAALYPLTTEVVDVRAGFRLQYFAGELFLPSVNAQIGGTYKVMGVEKLKWSWLTTAGVMTPIGGTAANGDVGYTYGVGGSLKYQVRENLEVGLGYLYERIEQLDRLRAQDVQHVGLIFKVKF